LQAYDGGEYATARREWLAAAKSSDVDALNGLAGLYAGGLGVRQDFRQAARWYEKAARRGHVTAQLNLGDYYARGRGVQRNLVAAHMWLSLAARQGNGWADARRRAIARRMTPRQLAEARAKTKAFRVVK